METIVRTPCYLSRVSALPTTSAPELFDEWCERTARESGAAPVVTVSDGELVVEPASLERFTDPGFAHPYRRVAGTLRFRNRWVRDLGVEVELGPWSGTHSEVALRYAGRRLPGARRGDRFAAVGLDVLNVLSATLAWYRTQTDTVDDRVIIAA